MKIVTKYCIWICRLGRAVVLIDKQGKMKANRWGVDLIWMGDHLFENLSRYDTAVLAEEQLFGQKCSASPFIIEVGRQVNIFGNSTA